MTGDLDAKGTIWVLWDQANNCWCHEKAYPDGYEEIRDGYLAHIHIKDVQVNTPKAFLEIMEMGKGQLADQFHAMPVLCGLIYMEELFLLRASTIPETETTRQAFASTLKNS